MLIRGFRGYFLSEMKVTLREPLVLLSQFALPVAMYVFFGLIFGRAPTQAGGADFYNGYTASFVAVTLLSVALMNIGPSLVIYKELGFLKQLMVTPLDTTAIWLSAIVKSLFIFMVGFAELLLAGWLMFHKLPVHGILQMTLAIALSAYGLFSLGFMLGAIFKISNTAFAISGVLFQIMLLLSGASIPLAAMPRSLQAVSGLLPMTHAVKILQSAWHGDLFTRANLLPCAVLIASGTVFAIAARQLFRRSFS